MTRRRHLHWIAGTIVLVALFAGCKHAQPVTQASTETPASYSIGNDSSNVGILDWKEYFSDPVLIALIDSVLARNLDANTALQRIEAAGARVQFSKGELLPKTSAMATPAIRRYGLYTMDGAGNSTTDILPGQLVPTNLTDYLVGIQASWEADIAGKLRNRKKAAQARYLSTIEARNWLLTNLVAETALAYYELLALDDELLIVKENIALQENASTVVAIQKEAAAANELAVEQFQAQLLNTRTLEFEIKQRIVEVESRVNFLAGRFPQPVRRESTGFESPATRTFPIGVPSDLLRNRSDVRQAELEVTASKADVRAARAAFYPSLNITGSAGFQSFRADLLFETPESFIFTAVGNLVVPLINRNAIKAELKAANALQLEALYNYQRCILNGFVEVHNEVNNLENLLEMYRLKDDEVRVRTKSVATATDLFRTGRATYLEVLLTQQNVLDARLDFNYIKRRQLYATVGLYRSLGGGWR